MTTYLAIGRNKCRPLGTSILFVYVSNRMALDFGYIFLEINQNGIVPYCSAIAQGEKRLILKPFHFRPLSAGIRRARLETETEARPSPRHQPCVVTARPAASPPRAARRPRAQPLSPNIVCTVRRMGRGEGLDAHSLRATRGPVAAARACRGDYRDRSVVGEGVEELPVLVGKHRIVHDVGGWRVLMLEIRPSRDALTMVNE
jgi:hypothetical protein